jgi:glycosyltransferase involved in cell wall biosynthesis
MNILFMTKKRDDLVCLDYGHYLEQAIGKIANCKWAGRGWPDYRSESLNTTVSRLMPNADWVIYYDFEIRRELLKLRIPPYHKRSYQTATILSDLHKEPRKYIGMLNNERWDAYLMLYTQLAARIDYNRGKGWKKTNPKQFLEGLGAPKFPLTPSINPSIFNMMSEERDLDALFLGNAVRSFYPLRNDIYNNLKALGIKNKWKTFVKWSPKGMSLNRKKDEYLERGEIVGSKYADYLSRAKCFLFGTSVFKYPLLKFFEGMASGACVFSDAPLLSESLHLKAGENYVNINIDNWKDKLKYYLENEGERKRIALEGYKMTMKYHTNEARARELVDFLEANK